MLLNRGSEQSPFSNPEIYTMCVTLSDVTHLVLCCQDGCPRLGDFVKYKNSALGDHLKPQKF